MRRWIAFLIAAVFIFGAAQAAMAGADVGFRKGFARDPVNMVDELKLNEEQAAKIREMNESRFREMSTLRDRERQACHEFRQQQFTPGVKQEQLREKAGEIEKLQQQRRDSIRECPDQMRGILTDEQYKLWCEFREKHCQNPDGPQAPGQGRGHGPAHHR